MTDQKLRKYFENQMFKNYCGDENRFTNQPNAISTITIGQNYTGRKSDPKRGTKVILFNKYRMTIMAKWMNHNHTKPRLRKRAKEEI